MNKTGRISHKKGPTIKKSPKRLSPTVQKRKQFKRAISELDGLWSKMIRKVWGNKCGYPGCNNKERLAAHHYIHKSQGFLARWNLDDGIALCYGCHIHKVHNRGMTEPIRQAIIDRIGQGRFDEMLEVTTGIWKPTLEELQEIKEAFSKQLNE